MLACALSARLVMKPPAPRLSALAPPPSPLPAATHAIVIFENGEDEFAQRISVSVISVADLPAAAQ